MDIVMAQIVSGLVRGSFLFLVTIGLTLIYGVLSVLNVAHVSFYMLGAYFACTFWKIMQGYDFSYWVAIPLTCLTMGTIGLIIEVVLMRRLYTRIQGEVLLGIAVLVGVGLWFWLHRTKFGKIVRATQSDREMVSALGIPVPLIYTSVFAISALLAGLAGAVWVATGIVQPGRLDMPMLPQVFCTMVIGGMGSLVGTAAAALIVGEVFALSILIAPKAGMVAIFVVTALILIILPWGLFGTKGRLE